MKSVFELRLAIVCLAAVLSTAALEGSEPRKKDSSASEAATRLQVFLDRAQFAPGKIDGHFGEFTLRALALYRQANGSTGAATPLPAAADAKKPVPPPDVSDLDLASVEPLFVDYTVTEEDLAAVGEVASDIAEQARQKSLPYQSAAEAIAEKFHTDVDYLEELNVGKTKSIKAGAILRVPNVEPFQLTAVKDLKPGSELGPTGANEYTGAGEAPSDSLKNEEKKSKNAALPKPPPGLAVRIDTTTNMLSVHDGEKIIAAYPVTIGSDRTKSPIGDWKVAAIAKMPNFRYDESMLEKGERSEDFHLLPPGPNNPVGVVWIALNKKGIGLHGTNEPDTIGRSSSHGCIRLANWDVVRVANNITKGVPVSIH